MIASTATIDYTSALVPISNTCGRQAEEVYQTRGVAAQQADCPASMSA